VTGQKVLISNAAHDKAANHPNNAKNNTDVACSFVQPTAIVTPKIIREQEASDVFQKAKIVIFCVSSLSARP